MTRQYGCLARVHRSVSKHQRPRGQQNFQSSTVDVLFGEMIKSTRVVGGFLRKKIILYNTGSVLFVLAVVLLCLRILKQCNHGDDADICGKLIERNGLRCEG